MKKLRAAAVIVFIASLVLLGLSAFRGRADKIPGPEIQMDADLIEVSVNDGEDVLKRGVTATDAAGNDVTDTLEVESIGPFNEAGRRVVTYVAFDPRGKVGRAKREVSYTDYASPRFRFERPLLLPANSKNLLTGVTVEDDFDGEQYGNIWIQYDGVIDSSIPGEYQVVLEATNSAGDTASLPVTIEIYDEAARAGLPVIRLKEYVVYLEEGAQWNPQQYLDSVLIGGTKYAVGAASGETAAAGTETATGGEAAEAATDTAATTQAANRVIAADRITVNGNVNTAVPGNYEAVYTFEDTEHGTGTGSVRLYVVVTERRSAGR